MSKSAQGLSFIGREPELAALRAHLEAAKQGHGSLVLVSGEPGIGKTRLVEVLAQESTAPAVRTLWGRSFEREGAPAFWPWIQIVRACIHDRDPAAVAEELGHAAPMISALVWGVPPGAADGASPARQAEARSGPASDPEQARFRLFEGFSTCLARLSRTQPLLLVFDDLQWSDTASLQLLRFVARHLREERILLIGTYRDADSVENDVLRQIAADSARTGIAQLLGLRGLSRPETALYLQDRLPSEPRPAVVDAVHTWTEGNPFFMSEVVQLMVREGWAVGDASTGPVPQLLLSAGVRDVVERRLSRLNPDDLSVLGAAAVIGREFGLATLQRLPALAGIELLEAIERAEAAQVVVAIPGALGRYRFAHALIRETLYARLLSAGRARLHALRSRAGGLLRA